MSIIVATADHISSEAVPGFSSRAVGYRHIELQSICRSVVDPLCTLRITTYENESLVRRFLDKQAMRGDSQSRYQVSGATTLLIGSTRTRAVAEHELSKRSGLAARTVGVKSRLTICKLYSVIEARYAKPNGHHIGLANTSSFRMIP